MAQHINLYQAHIAPKKQWLTAQHGLAFCALVACVMTVVTSAYKWRQHQAHQEISALNDQVQRWTAQALAAKRQDGLTMAERDELDRLRKLEGGDQYLERLIREGAVGAGTGFSPELQALARHASAHVWITGIVIHRGPSRLELKGRTTDTGALPDYLRDLQAEATFKGRGLAQLQVRSDTANTTSRLQAADFLVSSGLPGAAGQAAVGVTP